MENQHSLHDGHQDDGEKETLRQARNIKDDSPQMKATTNLLNGKVRLKPWTYYQWHHITCSWIIISLATFILSSFLDKHTLIA